MIDYNLLNAMREMLYYTVIAVCLITAPTLLVGLVISVIQAATQINEVTMTFIPKMIVMFLVLYFFSPILMQKLVFLAQNNLTNLIMYIK